ncbi:DNA binding protein [[Candida] boidinii]|nr:DNA binding protein [[Candida] boidinii]
MSNQQYNYSSNNGYAQVPGAPQANRGYDYSQFQYQAQPQYQQPQQQIQSQATYPQLQKQISTGTVATSTPVTISQNPGYSVAAGNTGYMVGQQQQQLQQQQLVQDYGYGRYGYTNSAAQYNQYQTSQPQITAGRLQVTPSYGPSATTYSPVTQDTKTAVSGATASTKQYSNTSTSSVADSIGQIQPANSRPKVTTTMWEDEKTLCYQVEANGVSVVRRSDNNMINGTKLLNVARMTRGRRDGILKSEKTRHVVKIGSMHLKGVWIPFDRALFMAQREGIVDILYPLFVKDIKRVIQKGAPTPSSSSSVAATKSSQTESSQSSAVSSAHTASGADYASSLSTATTAPASSSTIADKVLPAVSGANTAAVARTYPSGSYASSTGSVGNTSQYASYYQASGDQQAHQQPYYYSYSNYQQPAQSRQGQQISQPQIHNPQQTSQQR